MYRAGNGSRGRELCWILQPQISYSNPMKNWKETVGRWHLGQLIIAGGVVLFVALMLYGVGVTVLLEIYPPASGLIEVLAYLSLAAALLTVAGAIVVLWIWFGAPRKP